MVSASKPVPHRNYVQRLYRQALKTAFDHHAYERDIYRQHCLHIRARFEANRNEANPVRIQALIRQTEEELLENKHPRPYVHPTAPGGVKYYRLVPPPLWLVRNGPGNWVDDPVEFEKVGGK